MPGGGGAVGGWSFDWMLYPYDDAYPNSPLAQEEPQDQAQATYGAAPHATVNPAMLAYPESPS